MPGQPNGSEPVGQASPTDQEFAASSASLVKQLKLWFTLLLILQASLLVLRWHFGDAHGAMLMFAVWSVGVLSLSVGSSGVDAIYGGYFGLMAFVSGLLDLNMAIEHIIWLEWKEGHREAFWKGDISRLVKPSIYLACSVVQLSSAFVAYLVYKESDVDDFLDMHDETMPFFASQDQARIYNSALRYGERQSAVPEAPVMKPFMGVAHKLP
mmetsp:Transcript_158295/g.507702  ORF Transcript_158295/g.507702 Transcript_158295/m.507702 type:complete len:211 (+) Transcript_158295:101-733(+)